MLWWKEETGRHCDTVNANLQEWDAKCHSAESAVTDAERRSCEKERQAVALLQHTTAELLLQLSALRRTVDYKSAEEEGVPGNIDSIGSEDDVRIALFPIDDAAELRLVELTCQVISQLQLFRNCLVWSLSMSLCAVGARKAWKREVRGSLL